MLGVCHIDRCSGTAICIMLWLSTFEKSVCFASTNSTVTDLYGCYSESFSDFLEIVVTLCAPSAYILGADEFPFYGAYLDN